MILATVKGQSLKMNHPKVVADTIAYLEMSVQFKTEDWSGLKKYVHFSLGDEHYSFELVDDKITQDMHLDLPAGEWEVYIHGALYTDAETVQRITTEPVTLYVYRTGSLDGEPFPELSGSVGEKVIATSEAALAKAKEAYEASKLVGSPIVDVEALPTENINNTAFYRTSEGVYWYDGEWHKVPNESDIVTLEADITKVSKQIEKNIIPQITAEAERATEAEGKLAEDISNASKQIEENILPHIVNADYDENDTDSKAHILNRPFYDTRVTDENGEETGELKTLEDKYLDLENRAKMQEVESIAKGANQSLSFGNYSTMIDVFNDLPKDKYRVGQNVYIVELGVPDLWISEIKDTSIKYDMDLEGGDGYFKLMLETSGSYQVGYYVFSRLETQKVDLTNYVKYTDEPGNTVAGGKPGVVGLNYATSCGLRIEGGAGKRYLMVYGGNDTDVLRRNGACVLTLANMDSRVKAVITGAREKNVNGSWVKSYGNQPTLTDTEKSSAKAWLGVPTSYDELKNKPFGSGIIKLIDITYTEANGGESLTNGTAYLQTEKTYSVDELIGATVEYHDGSSISDTTTLSRSHIREESEDGVRLFVGNCNIYVAYTTNYKPANSEKPFSRTGVYFDFYDDGDPYYVRSLIKEGEGIIYLDNKYLDLANHPVIKDILSKLK